MKQLFQLIVLASLFAFVTGCEKFEDGGLISKTEKNLEGQWKLDKYLKDNVDKTASLLIRNYEENYTSSGVYGRNYTDKNGNPVTDDGRWSFRKEQEELGISDISSMEINAESGTVSSSYYRILKLDKNAYWYSFVNGSATHEFRFVRK